MKPETWSVGEDSREAIPAATNKWEEISKKFSDMKMELSQKMLTAGSAQDMINLGRVLQERGAALEAEINGAETIGEQNVYQEASSADFSIAAGRDPNELINAQRMAELREHLVTGVWNEDALAGNDEGLNRLGSAGSVTNIIESKGAKVDPRELRRDAN